MNRRLLGMSVAVVALGLVLAMAGTARAETKIGVVDIIQVTDDYQRTKDASADLKAEMDGLNAKTEQRVAALTDVRNARDAFERGSKEWLANDDRFIAAKAEAQSWAVIERTKLERKHTGVLLDVYRQITAVVSRLAKEKKLDMVFTKAFLAPPAINVDDAQSLDDLKTRIMNQKVLFPTDVTDLTKEVSDILNAEYAAAKKLPPAAGGLSPGSLMPMTPAAPPKAAPKAGGSAPKG